MTFNLTMTEAELESWLASSPIEDELREAYIRLEAKRADLWTSGHIDSFRRDRHELDGEFIQRLVKLKFALATTWIETGQFARFGDRQPVLV